MNPRFVKFNPGLVDSNQGLVVLNPLLNGLIPRERERESRRGREREREIVPNQSTVSLNPQLI